MMRINTPIILAVALSIFFVPSVYAAPIAASTELAIAKDVEATISRVSAVDGSWTKMPSGALAFGGLKMKSGVGVDGKEWSVFLPDYYYAVDVSAKKGTFPKDGSIQVTYNEGLNPNSPGHGLGYKATITYCKTYFPSRDDYKNNKTSDQILGKVLIKDGLIAPVSSVKGGWLRMYIGIVANDPNASPADPAGSEVFSTNDKAGDYSGGITITLI